MKGLLLIFSFLALSAGSIDSVFEKEPCSSANTAFEEGEKLVYKLYYNWGVIWLSAGEVEFTVKSKGDKYHITAIGKTYGSYEWFYKVDDRFESVIDKTTLLPDWSLKDIKEGGYTRYDKLTFDHDNNAVTSHRGKTIEDIKETVFPISDCVNDILSVIYQLRSTDVSGIEEGDKLPLNFFLDGENYNLDMTFRGLQNKVKVKGLGKIDSYHFTPDVIAGDVFQKGTEMDIFVSRDENKIPVLIESPLSVGTVKAVLKSYSGLRNEFSSKG